MYNEFSKKYIFLGCLLIVLSIIGLFCIFNRTNNRSTEASTTVVDKCKNCNILLLDVDILRADALPCYGYHRNTAPNICAFAEKSVTFKDNYSTSFWTFPDIFSTITSLYPVFHRMHTSYVNNLSPDLPTMAKVLKKEGYKTIFVGESHNSAIMSEENGGLIGYDLITQEPIEKVIAEATKDSTPWFIHYYTADLHFPYFIKDESLAIEKMTPPENMPSTLSGFEVILNSYLKKHYREIFKPEAIEKYWTSISKPEVENDVELTDIFNQLRFNDYTRLNLLVDAWKPVFNAYIETFDKNNSNDIAYLRMLYDSNIKIIDERLKDALQIVNSDSLNKQTITVFMSNHGEAFGEHGTFSHDDNHYTELFYTPLIISAPGLNKKTINQTTSNIDIFPTIMDLAGINKDDYVFQGRSLVPIVNGEYNDPNYFSLSETAEGVVLQNKSWLYFLPNTASDPLQGELYDKTADPMEKNNVVSKYYKLASTLFEKADVIRSYGGIIENISPSPIKNNYKLDSEKIKRMQKEGYF